MAIGQPYRHNFQSRALQLSGSLQNYNGWLVQTPGLTEVYLIDNGKRRWIPHTNLIRGLFNGDVRQVFGLETIPVGMQIQIGTGLFRTSFTGDKVFWLDIEDTGRIVKRWLTSPSAMERYHFNWDAILPVFGLFANAVPDGREII